jgi:hypothetical protein
MTKNMASVLALKMSSVFLTNNNCAGVPYWQSDKGFLSLPFVLNAPQHKNEMDIIARYFLNST